LNGNENLEELLAPTGSFLRAGGGLSLRGLRCGGEGQGPCIQSAGGAGGGGNSAAGSSGSAFPEPGTLFGAGGTIFGLDNPRLDGEYILLGGTGGGGGGGNPHVSGSYQAGYPGQFRFRRDALHAPGTGGGGGGGVLYLAAQALTLRPTGSILARGGNAYAGIDLSGNAGAGAGGTVFIQVKGTLTIESGALIDVSGGEANLDPPPLPGQDIPEYPTNVHLVAGVPKVDGGEGGDGAPGRIRIEAEVGSIASRSGVNSSLSSGPFLLDTISSVAVSRSIRVGVGPGQAAGSHTIELGDTLVKYFDFGQPNTTDSVVMWQGARESLDVHGAVGAYSTLSGSFGLLGTHRPRTLRDHEFIRFVIPFLSNGSTRETQVIQELRLDYSMLSGQEILNAQP